MLIFQPPIICCILGAVAVQLLQVIETSKLPRKKRQDYTSLQFYFNLLCSIGIAGIIGYIYFDGDHSYGKIVYFHTGVSSPVLVKKLYARMPAVVRAKS